MRQEETRRADKIYIICVAACGLASLTIAGDCIAEVVDEQFVLGWCLHRKVGWFGPLENLVDIDGSASGQVIEVCRVAHQPSHLHIPPGSKHRRQAVLELKLGQKVALNASERRGDDEESISALLHQRSKGNWKVVARSCRHDAKLHPEFFG